MIPSRDKRGACGRAQRRGMELCVTRSCLGNAIQGRRRNHATERALNAIALVIGHDKEDVGGPSEAPRAGASTESNQGGFP